MENVSNANVVPANGSLDQAMEELTFWLFGGDRPPFKLVKQTLFSNQKLWTDAKVWGFTDPNIRVKLFDAISRETIGKPWISDKVTNIEERKAFYDEFLEGVAKWRG